MAGHVGASNLTEPRHADGEPAERLREMPAKAKKTTTAAEAAEAGLKRCVGRATWVLDRVLRTGEPRGLTVEEYQANPALWRLKMLAAEKVLKLALGTRSRTTKPGGTGKGAGRSAEAEPEDDSGVPGDLFSHLRGPES